MARGARRWPAAAAVLLLAACSTTPPKKSVYYQDDGPPDRVPVDIAAIPDATPRVEPPFRAASKPYTALGRSYTPLTGDPPFRQRGLASWYGKQFHGSRTANGEIYDMFGMTAAHPLLPIPSYVRVTNVRDGRSVIVRVNDRGPFKNDRVIDLSYAAASKLGIAAAGTGEVEIERITMTQIASGEFRREDPRTRGDVALARAQAPAQAPPALTASSAPATAVPQSMVTPVSTAPAATVSPSAPLPGWAVQLGVFSQEANAQQLAGRVAALLAFTEPAETPAARPRVEKDGTVYRVLVGATNDRASAQSLARDLEKLLDHPTTLLLR
jgi:rare lipoprotein A